MAVTVDPASAARHAVPLARLAFLLLAALSVAATAAAAVDGWDGGLAGRVGWICLTLVWALAGAARLLRLGSERLGILAVSFALSLRGCGHRGDQP